MKFGTRSLATTTVLLAFCAPAAAQAPAAAPPASKPVSPSLGMVVFPAKGQIAQQQSQDEGECYAWAKGQTGVDPMAPRLLGANYALAHELFFDTLAEAETAMTSTSGRLAGSLLQRMTGGKMALFFADHREDELENILKYRKPEE